MAVITIFPDGRLAASGSTSVTVPIGGGDVVATVTITDLKKIERIMEYEFSTSPISDPGTPVNAKISGNVVGFTLLGVPRGTTVTADLTVVGF